MNLLSCVFSIYRTRRSLHSHNYSAMAVNVAWKDGSVEWVVPTGSPAGGTTAVGATFPRFLMCGLLECVMSVVVLGVCEKICDISRECVGTWRVRSFSSLYRCFMVVFCVAECFCIIPSPYDIPSVFPVDIRIYSSGLRSQAQLCARPHLCLQVSQHFLVVFVHLTLPSHPSAGSGRRWFRPISSLTSPPTTILVVSASFTRFLHNIE